MNGSAVAINIRKILYRNLAKLDRGLLHKQNQLVILCYHSFDTADWRFAVSPERFEEQLRYMLSFYQNISLQDISTFVRNKKTIGKPSFAITIDDGYKSVWRIRNICQKLGIKPALFILSDPTNANRQELKTNEEFLSWEEIKELKKIGWEIGCHSATHPNFSGLTKEKAEYEILTSGKELEKRLGFPVNYFAYPRGRFNEDVRRIIARSNYQLGLTMDDGKICPGTNPYLIPRIGVDGSHEFDDFRSLFSPSVVLARKLIRHSPLGGIYERTI